MFGTLIFCLISVVVVVAENDGVGTTIPAKPVETLVGTTVFDDKLTTVEGVTDVTTTIRTTTPTKIKPLRNTVVNVQEGALKGLYRKGFYHFIGVKYGEAPLGERR